MDEVPSSENWKKTRFPQNDEMLHGIQQEEVQSPALGKEEPHAPGTCWKADQLESSFAGKDLGVLVVTKEIINQQRALETKKTTSILSIILAGIHHQQVEEGDPFYTQCR